MTTTSSPTIILQQYRVWVMRPDGDAETGYTYPWEWSRWALQTRLIVHAFRPAAGGMGECDLELLRQTRQDERDALNRYHGDDVVVPRAWVAISVADRDTPDDIEGTTPTVAAIVWWGFLGDLPGTIVEQTGEHIGPMKAKEIGHLLDQVALGSFTKISGSVLVDDTENGHGWCQASADGSYPVPINSPPTANIRHKDGYIVGNAKSIPSGAYQGYVFARLPEDCGSDASQLWTRWRLLGHIIKFCKPTGLPTITATAGGATSGTSYSVLHIDSVPPGSPATGDAYLVATGASGAWTGHDDDIATWNGSAWDFTTPAVGIDLVITSTGTHLTKTDSGWETNSLVSYLDSTTDPEVYELRNLKYRGALEMLFPYTQGLDYKFSIGSNLTSWVISIYSATESSDYGVPAATQENIDLSACENVGVTLSPTMADLPDEVAFEGGCCLFGFTVSNLNDNLDKWWTADLAVDYDDADDWERNQPQFDDAYTLFHAKPDANGDLRRSDNPGDTATNDGPLIPEVTWDGTTARLSTTSRCPYLPTARFTSVIPWDAGRQSDGTDARDDKRKAQPAYLKPKVFYYDSTLEADQWAELSDSGRINFFTNGQTPEVSADDRAAAIRVRFSPKHLLGLNEFDGFSAEGQPIIDWQKMLVTIAMPSDQRVRVSKRRQVNGADLPNSKVITRLTLRDESLGFWCMLKGTVIGLKVTGGDVTPDRVTATNIDTQGGGSQFGYSIRNDWGKVERNAKRLAAWAFKQRSSGTIDLAHPDVLPSWLRIGAMIGEVQETADATGAVISHTANAVIRSYTVTLGESPRVVATLEALPMPTFIKGEGSASPASGGAVSPSLGGTIPQAVQQLQARVGALDADAQRKIIIPPLIRETVAMVRIIGGNTVNSAACIQWVADPLSLSSSYDPDVDTVYPAGLGYGWLYDMQGRPERRVLVRHNWDGHPSLILAGDSFVAIPQWLTIASGPSAGQVLRVFSVRIP